MARLLAADASDLTPNKLALREALQESLAESEHLKAELQQGASAGLEMQLGQSPTPADVVLDLGAASEEREVVRLRNEVSNLRLKFNSTSNRALRAELKELERRLEAQRQASAAVAQHGHHDRQLARDRGAMQCTQARQGQRGEPQAQALCSRVCRRAAVSMTCARGGEGGGGDWFRAFER